MKKITKNLVLAGLALLVCICMVGCGGCGKNKAIVEVDKDAIYREEEIKVDFPNGFEADRMMFSNGKIYFSGYSWDKKTYESKTFWGNVNADGSNLVINDMKNADGEPIYFNNMFVTDDGNVGFLYYQYIAPEDPTDEYDYGISIPFLVMFSSDGKKIKEINLGNYVGENGWIQNVQCIDGTVVALTESKILYFDSSYKVAKEVENDGSVYFDTLLKLKNGSYAVVNWDDEGENLYKFDTQSFKTTDKIEIPFSLYNYRIMSGGASGYDLILRDNNKVFGFNIGDTELKTLVNFIDSDIYTGYLSMFEATGVNEFISSSSEWDGDVNTVRVCKYTKVNPEDVADKQVITLGCLYMWDELKRDVINFNRNNQDVRITVVDYNSYNTENDWDAGTTKFNSDIASGKGPDIIVAQNANDLVNYFKKGLFVDLNKYLDKDEEINKEDFFPNVIEMLSDNGKLYCLSPMFYLETAIAKKSLLNGKTSWTMQEMMEFEKTIPEGSVLFEYQTRESMLSTILSASGSTFIDEKNGKCNFDSDEFIALLEYIKSLPEEISYDDAITYGKDIAIEDDYATKWRNNKVIIMGVNINNLRNFNYNEKGTFGEAVEFIGYPTSEGNGSVAFFENTYAISAKSGNPDAAWEFIRTRFTKEAMDKIEYGIPLSMSRFDELAKEATQKQYYIDEDGEKVEYDEEYWIGDQTITISPISTERVAEVKSFIMSVNKVQSYHEDIIPIIEEEAAYFFEGQKSAKDVAQIIQSRLTIYINEKQ